MLFICYWVIFKILGQTFLKVKLCSVQAEGNVFIMTVQASLRVHAFKAIFVTLFKTKNKKKNRFIHCIFFLFSIYKDCILKC